MIHRLTGGPQAVALDRLGKDYRRLTFGVNGVVIGVVNLVAIMTTARKMQDLVVAHVFDQLQQLRVLAKEMFAGVSAAVGFVVLNFAGERFGHALLPQAGVVLCRLGARR